MMDSLHLDESIDHPSPAPRSNRGYRPSAFIKTLTLMPHEGGFRLDDVRHIQEDGALCTVLGIDPFLQTTPLGDGLRRMGAQAQIQDAWVKVNQALLRAALHRCKRVTLDIDATEIVADKADAEWPYNKNKGFMPRVGHIAETGQGVAVDFRPGNVPPAQANLGLSNNARSHCPPVVPSKPCVLMRRVIKPILLNIVMRQVSVMRFAPNPVRPCGNRLTR